MSLEWGEWMIDPLSGLPMRRMVSKGKIDHQVRAEPIADQHERNVERAWFLLLREIRIRTGEWGGDHG
jgi:hypothetical protein